MLGLLADPSPEIRRLAAQALAWEPKGPSARLVPKLLERLDDPDPRVVREVALADRPPRRAPAAAARRRPWSAGSTPTPRPTRRPGMACSGPWSGWARPAWRRWPWPSGPAGGSSARPPSAGSPRSGRPTPPSSSPAWPRSPTSARPSGPGLVRQFRDIPVDVPLATGALADWTWAAPRGRPDRQARGARRLPARGQPGLVPDRGAARRRRRARPHGRHPRRRPDPPARLDRQARCTGSTKSGTSPAERLAVAGPSAGRAGRLRPARSRLPRLRRLRLPPRRAPIDGRGRPRQGAPRARTRPCRTATRPQARGRSRSSARPPPGSPSVGGPTSTTLTGRPPRRPPGAPEGGTPGGPSSGRRRSRPQADPAGPRATDSALRLEAEARGRPLVRPGRLRREARSAAQAATRSAGRGAGRAEPRPRRPPRGRPADRGPAPSTRAVGRRPRRR